jgi:hypothetical protein
MRASRDSPILDSYQRVGGDAMATKIEMHTARWMAELELAGRAAHPEAARAHLGLSTLHFQRMLELQRRFDPAEAT